MYTGLRIFVPKQYLIPVEPVNIDFSEALNMSKGDYFEDTGASGTRQFQFEREVEPDWLLLDLRALDNTVSLNINFDNGVIFDYVDLENMLVTEADKMKIVSSNTLDALSDLSDFILAAEMTLTTDTLSLEFEWSAGAAPSISTKLNQLIVCDSIELPLYNSRVVESIRFPEDTQNRRNAGGGIVNFRKSIAARPIEQVNYSWIDLTESEKDKLELFINALNGVAKPFYIARISDTEDSFTNLVSDFEMVAFVSDNFDFIQNESGRYALDLQLYRYREAL